MALFGLVGQKQPDGKRRLSPQARSIIAYTHLPGILPRIRSLGDKFGHFAFLLALIYRSARLLPPGHPMVNPANIGRFGVRDVIATAANSLVIKRDNLDQIVIFGAVAVALIMIVIQAVLIALYAFMGSASAQDTNMFTTQNPDTDLAFKFLGQVFGVQNIFGSVTSQAGLHAILGFYSTAMMIIAVVIVVYYLITIVGESAQTGTPFGKRFNGLWAPIRLVLALGLLVPLGGGLNTAQYMTLYVAKFASSLATNAWIKYTTTFTSTSVTPTMLTPSVQGLGAAIFNAEACRALYNKRYPERPVRLLLEYSNDKSMPAQMAAGDLDSKVGSVRYVWTREPHGGKINEATCGSLTMQVFAPLNAGSDYERSVRNLEIEYQKKYVEVMGSMRNGFTGSSGTGEASESSPAGKFAKKYLVTNGASATERNNITLQSIASSVASIINSGQAQMNGAQNQGDSTIRTYSAAVIENMKKDAKERGWASAGSYYVEIARVNQGLSEAAQRSFPMPSEGVSAVVDNQGNSVSSWWTWFGRMFSSSGRTENAVESEVNAGMSNLPEIVRLASGSITPVPQAGQPNQPSFSAEFTWQRPLLALSRFLFGDALLKLMDEQTANVNPMERFIQAGSDILDRSEKMAYALVAGQAGSRVLNMPVTTSIGAGAFTWWMTGDFYSGVAWAGIVALAAYMPTLVVFFLLLGLVAGILLFYILPLMPFMMFFFSVVNWVIEVAEAFIAAPLFALSHLRIDGEGLPGQTAYAGWLTLFGILIRPILIILGLIIASLIFGAAAYFLTFIYKQAIFSYRNEGAGVIDLSTIGQVGILFYVLLFVYMLYILANSCFKLIDTIPDKAMRWIGGQQPFTGDRPIDIGNMQSMALAGYAGVTQGKDAIGGAMKDAGQQWDKYKGRDRGGSGGSAS